MSEKEILLIMTVLKLLDKQTYPETIKAAYEEQKQLLDDYLAGKEREVILPTYIQV